MGETFWEPAPTPSHPSRWPSCPMSALARSKLLMFPLSSAAGFAPVWESASWQQGQGQFKPQTGHSLSGTSEVPGRLPPRSGIGTTTSPFSSLFFFFPRFKYCRENGSTIFLAQGLNPKPTHRQPRKAQRAGAAYFALGMPKNALLCQG